MPSSPSGTGRFSFQTEERRLPYTSKLRWAPPGQSASSLWCLYCTHRCACHSTSFGSSLSLFPQLPTAGQAPGGRTILMLAVALMGSLFARNTQRSKELELVRGCSEGAP